MESEKNQSSQRLMILDGLRGIAAVLVVLHHEPRPYGDIGVFSRAYLAVDFFFLLSGFVLTLSFEPRMRAGLGTEAFLRMRIRRLWPLMFVGILIGAVATLRVLSPATVAQLFFLAVILFPLIKGTSALYPINGPIWSLFFELVANLCHSLGLLRLRDNALLLVAIFFGALLIPMVIYFGMVGVGDVSENWWGGFIRIGFSYTLGCWMGRHYRGGEFRFPGLWWLTIVVFVAVLTLAPIVPLSRALGDILIVTIALPSFLWLAVSSRLPERLGPVMTALGKLSYPLYVIHIPVLNLGLWAAIMLGPQYYLAMRAVAIIAAFGLSWFLAHTSLARGMGDKLRKKRRDNGSYQPAT